jgi:frataxin-like iron-binding protein CyaY
VFETDETSIPLEDAEADSRLVVEIQDDVMTLRKVFLNDQAEAHQVWLIDGFISHL